jgi:hypothetical protein
MVADGPLTCKIYYSGNDYPNHSIDVPISRWDTDNDSLIIESFLSSSNRDTLFAHITPGAYRELYNILGTPKMIDTTYDSGNTLILEPQDGYGISGLREKRTVAVKNIMDWHIPHTNRFGLKLECIRLDIDE